MNGKVRFVVTATCWNFIDQWYYDTIEKAREKFSEILVTRPKWYVKIRIDEISPQGSGSHG